MGGGGNTVNAAQQELVRATFARLAVMPEVAGALFYERLFAANPSFRPLFKKDMHSGRQADGHARYGRLQFA
jgi:hemoglobin-like flavoprotein